MLRSQYDEIGREEIKENVPFCVGFGWVGKMAAACMLLQELLIWLQTVG